MNLSVMESMPKITVILTSFNHEKYIREAIDSILQQTFGDFELFIWDDASRDGSWEIIRSYTDDRIKAFRNDVSRRGIYGINKTICELASGQYIAIHHSDDVWEPEKLERQLAYLEAHPETGAVFSNALAIGEDSKPLTDKQHFYSDVFRQPNRSRHQWLRHFFFSGNALCHPSVLMRKACYDECGVYRFGLAQLPDLDMWVRLCMRYDIHVLPESLIRFRVRDNEANSSGNRPEVRIRDRSEFHHILRQYFRVVSFEELVAIFPEAEVYRREQGCIPGFVMSMVSLGANAFPWARALAIETLLELMTDESSRQQLLHVYQFDYKDLVNITGQQDIFSLETVARLNEELFKCGESLGQLLALNEKTRAGEPDADRAGYEQAEHLFEVGRVEEGIAQLEKLAAQGSPLWEVYNDLAVQCFNAGEHDRAGELFREGMILEGTAGIVARNYTSMLMATGDTGAALEMLGRILQEHPDDADVIETLRQILSNLPSDSANLWRCLAVVADEGNSCHERRSAGRDAEARSTNDVRIFQIYYDEKTRAQLDPAFIPLDNLENPRPDWCEYWPIRKVLLEQTFDDDTYLGFFSPRFFEKTGMRGEEVLAAVRQSGDEVVSFSPFFDQGAIHINPFVQGEVNHPGMIAIAQNVLQSLGIEMDLQTTVSDRTTTIFSNYFVARYSFWKRWFDCFERIYAICEGPDSALKAKLISHTQYRAGTNYQMKIFILERLVTVLLEKFHLQCELALDIRRAPLSFPGTERVVDELLVTDWLKGRFRVTGQVGYLEIFGLYVGRLVREVLKPSIGEVPGHDPDRSG